MKMTEILIRLAELLGGRFDVLAEGAVRAYDIVGAVAACGAIDTAYRAECVSEAIGAWL